MRLDAFYDFFGNPIKPIGMKEIGGSRVTGCIGDIEV
jgi:hypothetical protein